MPRYYLSADGWYLHKYYIESDRNLFLPKYYAEYLTEYSAWDRYYSEAYYSAIYRIFGMQQNIRFRQIAKIWVSVVL